MKRAVALASVVLISLMAHAQQASQSNEGSLSKIYRGTAPRINDLIHTKLEVRFDFAKSWMYGKAWITLHPHFYPTDTLTLDAKGMDIQKVSLVHGTSNLPLKFSYDGLLLQVQLDKTYKSSDSYTIYIDYVSKPNDLKVKGSAAITDAKGLYFINPKGEQKDVPTQIWTQGETEANSAWFPTIDKPNQKSTEEIAMTVPDKYVTLSNGKLNSQKKNADGTRTDYWAMDLPHAPYLFFMGMGDYAVIKDNYKGKEVAYYVEKPYAGVARNIFGNTPEMIAFYARITGIEYPWVKYDQIVGRDYVSGAMENTTATLHEENAQQDARELVDGNNWEDVIAHELFHQWFGDLVTTESWSNLTLNESFADYSETLWNEYKYGKDAGDAVNFKGMQTYLIDPKNDSKNLVRFYYDDKEDMFDMVSYAKGGRILNMLRNYVGDSAFFKSLNVYLTNNKFRSAEAQQLRLAFEEVTGQDLNWFWNQWYYGNGHPKLNIDYTYDDASKNVRVIIAQTQEGDKAFRVPMAIDVYNGAQKYRHHVWLTSKLDTFNFAYSIRPDLVNVDGDKTLLCEKTDNKSAENFIHQYKHAPLYLDRREAIDYFAAHQDNPEMWSMLKTAMKDKFYLLRSYVLDKLDFKQAMVKHDAEPIIAEMAEKDPKTIIRSKAIDLLSEYKNPVYKKMFLKGTDDSSYSVAGSALSALAALDPIAATDKAQKLSKEPVRGKLAASIDALLVESGDLGNFDLVVANFNSINDLQDKLDILPGIGAMVVKTPDTAQFRKGVDLIAKFRDNFPGRQHDEIANDINTNILKVLAQMKEKAGSKEQAEYIKAKLVAPSKK